ncbi:unnamed protein product [Urochloa humidicola]
MEAGRGQGAHGHDRVAVEAVEGEEEEEVACECCGFTEECTAPYIARVRSRYGGRWICGLCGDAVGEELGRASPPRRSTATPASAGGPPRRRPPRGAPTTSSPRCACSCDAGCWDPRRTRRSPGGCGPRPVAPGGTRTRSRPSPPPPSRPSPPPAALGPRLQGRGAASPPSSSD